MEAVWPLWILGFALELTAAARSYSTNVGLPVGTGYNVLPRQPSVVQGQMNDLSTESWLSVQCQVNSWISPPRQPTE